MTPAQGGPSAGGLTRVGAGIDRAWRAIGLDPHGYAQRQPEKAERLAIWLLGLGQTIGYAGIYYIFAALLLAWDAALPWGKSWLTFAFMCAILTGAAVSPLAGRWVDLGRGRWLLGGGMALGAGALLLLGTAQSYAVFLLAWLVLGAAQGASLYEPCFAFVTRTTGARARRNITLITLVAGFASTLAYPSGAFLAESVGWRAAVWIFAGVVGLIGAPALHAGATMLECCPVVPRGAEARAPDEAAYRAARARPEFWLIFAAFPLFGFTGGMVIAHVIPILTGAGLSLPQAVLAASLFGPMQVAGRLATMLLGHRVQPLTVTAVSFSGLVCAVLVLLVVVPRVPMAAYLFALLFGASYGLVSILKPVVTVEVLGPRGYGRIAGVMAVPFLVAMAIAPQVGSVIWRLGGYDLALSAGLAAAALALAALLVLIGRVRRGR